MDWNPKLDLLLGQKVMGFQFLSVEEFGGIPHLLKQHRGTMITLNRYGETRDQCLVGYPHKLDSLSEITGVDVFDYSWDVWTPTNDDSAALDLYLEIAKKYIIGVSVIPEMPPGVRFGCNIGAGFDAQLGATFREAVIKACILFFDLDVPALEEVAHETT